MNAIYEVPHGGDLERAHGYASRVRSTAYDLIVLSPHFDDAVYSLAGTLLAARETGKKALVITVFGHGRAVAPSGTGEYDDYATRESEDREAMTALDVDFVWLNLPEWTFRGSRGRTLVAELLPHASFDGTDVLAMTARAIREVVDSLAAPGCTIYAPLAVGAHPDHRIVHEAAHALGDRTVRYYEDVPYALEDALVESRLAILCGLRGPRSLRLARATARIALRGAMRLLLLLPLSLMLACTELARRFGRGTGTKVDPLALRAFDLDIASFASSKARAVSMYRSQTKLFFDTSKAIESQLLPVERCWRITP